MKKIILALLLTFSAAMADTPGPNTILNMRPGSCTSGFLRGGSSLSCSVFSNSDIPSGYYLPTTSDQSNWNGYAAQISALTSSLATTNTNVTANTAAIAAADALIASLTSSLITTNSNVAANTSAIRTINSTLTTVAGEISSITSTIAALTSSSIANVSSITGSTVTVALNWVYGQINSILQYISNKTPTVFFVSTHGSDVACPATPCGDGTRLNPWASIDRANIAVAAMSPPASLTNPATVNVDPGFYSTLDPSFSYMCFTTYYSPTIAGNTGVSISDGMGGTLPITLNITPGCQLVFYGMSTTTDLTGAFGSSVIINDSSPIYPPNFETVTFYQSQVTGSLTLNSSGPSNANLNFSQFSYLIPNGSDPDTLTANTGNVTINNAFLFEPVLIHATAGNNGLFVQNTTFNNPVTLDSPNETYSAFASVIDSFVPSLTISGDRSFWTSDASSTPSQANTTYTNGAAYTSNNALDTGTDSIGNASGISGFSLTDALNWLQNNLLWLNGSSIMTGALNMGGNQINNVADPVNPQDAVTLSYMTTAISSAISGSTPPYTIQTADYTALSTDQFIYMNCSGTCNVFLPSVASESGHVYVVQSVTGYQVDVNANGGDTINLLPMQVVPPGSSMSIQDNSIEWRIF